MMKTSGSRRISSAIASRSASRMVMVTISVPAGTSGSGSATAFGAGGATGAFFGGGGGLVLGGRRGFRFGGRSRGFGRLVLFLGRRRLAQVRRTFAIGQNGSDR